MEEHEVHFHPFPSCSCSTPTRCPTGSSILLSWSCEQRCWLLCWRLPWRASSLEREKLQWLALASRGNEGSDDLESDWVLESWETLSASSHSWLLQDFFSGKRWCWRYVPLYLLPSTWRFYRLAFVPFFHSAAQDAQETCACRSK